MNVMKVVTCFFLLIHSGGAAAPPAPPSPPPPGLGQFSDYILTVQWPLTYCHKSKRCPRRNIQLLPRDFKLHGLWPEGTTVKSMELFDISLLMQRGNLIGGLLKEFISATEPLPLQPNTIPPSYKGFWSHEWQDHGTASGLTQPDYFELTLYLFGQVMNNFNQFRSKYTPGMTFDKGLLAADFDHFGMRPAVNCFEEQPAQGISINYLYELKFEIEKIISPKGSITYQFRSQQPNAGNCKKIMVTLPDK